MRKRVVHLGSIKDSWTKCKTLIHWTTKNGEWIKVSPTPLLSGRWDKVTCKRCLARRGK